MNIGSGSFPSDFLYLDVWFRSCLTLSHHMLCKQCIISKGLNGNGRPGKSLTTKYKKSTWILQHAYRIYNVNRQFFLKIKCACTHSSCKCLHLHSDFCFDLKISGVQFYRSKCIYHICVLKISFNIIQNLIFPLSLLSFLSPTHPNSIFSGEGERTIETLFGKQEWHGANR